MNKINDKLKKEVVSWLQRFAMMVRDKKYSNAEEFFDKDTFGFGTIAASYSSLAEYKTQHSRVPKNFPDDF